MKSSRVSPYRTSFYKRIFDFVIAFFLVIMLSPIMLVLAVTIRLNSIGPVLYRQRRVGRDGQEFFCIKFRTMVPDSAQQLERRLSSDSRLRQEWEQNFKLKDDFRITGIGHFLRRTSLDELPQLFNVLKGEMSLVGPRPVVQAEGQFYGKHFEDYKSIRPGMTGLWQVSGRNDLDYQHRVELDVSYIRRCSFVLDLRILLRTVAVVCCGKGAY